MCHTTTTQYLPCFHTLTSVTPCVAASGYLHSTFLSVLLLPPKCNRTHTSLNLPSFCPQCEAFWRERRIGGEEGRERLGAWRRRVRWNGAARPVDGEGEWEGWGFVTFEKEGDGEDSGRIDPGERSGVEARLDGIVDFEAADEEREVERRERRGSGNSTCTLWPGVASGDVEGLTEAEIVFERGEMDSREERAQLGSEVCVDVEKGEEIEELIRLPDLRAKDELVHPDAFELSELEDELPELTVDGFEQQELSMSPRPFPTKGLQRIEEGRKLC